MVTRSVLTKRRRMDYTRLPDPPRVPDMMEQVPAIMAFLNMLSAWFRHRADVFVGSGGYLWKTPHDGHGPHPDGSFAAGLEDPGWLMHSNGYIISEVGKPPDLVFEVGSRSTGRRDYTEKRETYAEYGVGEYWRFDHSGGEYHDAPLAGDRLNEDGGYEPIEIVREADGRLWGYSEALGLEFWWVWDESPSWHKGALRFPRSHERACFCLRSRMCWMRPSGQRRRKQRAESAEARMVEMEAELRRLRGE